MPEKDEKKLGDNYKLTTNAKSLLAFGWEIYCSSFKVFSSCLTANFLSKWASLNINSETSTEGNNKVRISPRDMNSPGFGWSTVHTKLIRMQTAVHHHR